MKTSRYTEHGNPGPRGRGRQRFGAGLANLAHAATMIIVDQWAFHAAVRRDPQHFRAPAPHG
jgi:hypothetical protein